MERKQQESKHLRRQARLEGFKKEESKQGYLVLPQIIMDLDFYASMKGTSGWFSGLLSQQSTGLITLSRAEMGTLSIYLTG